MGDVAVFIVEVEIGRRIEYQPSLGGEVVLEPEKQVIDYRPPGLL
jgi:hypothetical protein